MNIKILSIFALASAALIPAGCYANPAQDDAVIAANTALADQGLVSSAHPDASAAGQAILRKNGSAADAAMAMLLALTVVEPQSSGIGGGGFLLHHNGATGEIDTIDGRETAPASADQTLFLDAQGDAQGFLRAFQGGQSVGVPGNIRLMAMAHDQWGKLPWAELFEPAIALAENGYIVNARLAASLARLENIWREGGFVAAQQIYWKDGRPLREGERVYNPALAKLLRDIAQQGADGFYSGAVGEAIVAAVSQAPVNPVAMTMDDLAGYRAKSRDAVCSRYRGYKICGMGPPSSGAVTVQQILAMLERFDLKKMGKDDPQSWHLIGEAMQLAYADRNHWLGDMDFVDVPLNGLLDPGYIRQRSALIDPDRARNDYRHGTPAGAAKRSAGIHNEEQGTTHFVAVDGTGNIVSMTSTVEGPFGSQLIAGGMFLNNELTDFAFVPEAAGAPVANRVEPGKRPLSSMSPTIVYNPHGKPVFALGSAGGKRIIMHVTRALIGYIDFDLPIEQALALGNIFYSNAGGLILEEGTAAGDAGAALTAMGHRVSVSDLGSKLNAVARNPDGSWTGAADPRSLGNVALK